MCGGLDQGTQMTARMLSNVWAGQHVYSQAKQEVGRALRALTHHWGVGGDPPLSRNGEHSSTLHHTAWEMGPGDLGPRNGL